MCLCVMVLWSLIQNKPTVKVDPNAQELKATIIDLNKHIQTENTSINKEGIGWFQKNSLELVLFEKVSSIKISHSKYLVTSVTDFSVHKQSFMSLSKCCWLLSKIVKKLIDTSYPPS